MSELLPLPPELLAGGPPGVYDEAEIIRLMRSGDRGEYLEAAHEASQLLIRHGHDTRLAAVYLVGSFFERGPSGLPDLFDSVASEFQPLAGEREDLARTREAAVRWLCRAITTQVAFHTATRGDIWKRWTGEITSEELAEIEDKSAALVAGCPSCAATFAKLGRWARERLTPASASARKARAEEQAARKAVAEAPHEQLDPDPKLAHIGWDEPEPEPEPEPEAELGPEAELESETWLHEELQSEPEPGEMDFAALEGYAEEGDPRQDYLGEPHFARPQAYFDEAEVPRVMQARARPLEPGESALGCESPALLELCEKLRGFERLVERGELDKAAIIASDIQGVIENFDPLVYLPSLFGRYFQLLSKIVGEVEARWDAGDSTARRVLVQYYRADLDGFVND